MPITLFNFIQAMYFKVRSLKALFFFAVFISLFSSTAQSHEVRPSYLELIEQKKNSYSVLWKVPAKGKKLKLALAVKFADEVESISPPIEYFAGTSYIKKWQIYHSNGLKNSTITITGLQSTFTEALVRIEHLDGTIQVARLMPESPFLVVDASPEAGQVAKTYTLFGIKHILLGFDHLLFLLCLVLISGKSYQLIVTITGFTLAHSITLALSTLNWVTLSVAPVEAIIALSIIFLATEIVKGKRDTIAWKYPVAVSASFGLLHGFGFAAVLNELGLPQTEQITALLFFNLGVELGQLFFVGVIVLFIKLLSALKLNDTPRLWQQPTTYAIGSLAAFWLIERTSNFLL